MNSCKSALGRELLLLLAAASMGLAGAATSASNATARPTELQFKRQHNWFSVCSFSFCSYRDRGGKENAHNVGASVAATSVLVDQVSTHACTHVCTRLCTASAGLC
jgi:hypothetical protein